MYGMCVHGYSSKYEWCPACAQLELDLKTSNETQAGGNHYVDMRVQPWDVVDTWPLEKRIGFYQGNALKYIMRLDYKDDRKTNAAKALHLLKKLVEVLEGE